MLIEKTESLCPDCIKKVPAEIYVKDDIVWIRKTCKEHGEVNEKYWEDYGMYKKAKSFAHEGLGIENPNIDKERPDCPFDCGLCNKHQTHTGLANIVVTNRCDLRCWYCFFYAKEGDNIYEPTLDQFRKMLRNLKAERPIPTNAVQFTGGEPSLRDDVVDIVKIAKEEGFDHVQYNTNGIRFAHDAQFVKDLKEAGVSTAYLSFDGVSEKTNPKNHWEVPLALDNARKAKLGIVLVPTVIRGTNDHEVGDMIRFAAKNSDIVRGVNFQPVSLVGKMPRKERENARITIPGAIKKIEEQTDGEISKDDFYPVPCVKSVTHLAEAMSGRFQYDLSIHFACGMATYAFMDRGKMLPITRFVDVRGVFDYLEKISESVRAGSNKKIAKLKLLMNLKKFIDDKKTPANLKMNRILYDIFVKRDYSSLGDFHYNALFIGLMHFQDLYNYDVKRVERCDIHYATPDDRIIPFCAFNVLPEIYRDEIQGKFSIPVAEWEKRTGKKLMEGFYRRDKEKLRRMCAENNMTKDESLYATSPFR